MKSNAHSSRFRRRLLGLLSVVPLVGVLTFPAAATAAGTATTATTGTTGTIDSSDSTQDAPCGSVSATLVPSCGAWWGIWPRTNATGTMTTDLLANTTSLEQGAGRRFDIVSRYYGWNQQFPDQTDRALRDSGHHLLIDVRARNFGGPQNGAYTRWSDIASGSQDAVIAAMADRVKAFGAPVFLSFNQEPEFELEQGAGNPAGTAADYAAAYRHIHDVFAQRGVTNAVWVWWVMGYGAFDSQYRTLYPGDAYVDWVSYDPYDFNACHSAPAKDPATTFGAWYRWIDQAPFAQGKPLMLSEYGANGSANGGWYAGVPAAIKALPRIKAVVEFDSSVGGCDTRVTNSAANWAGFVHAGADPYFSQLDPARDESVPSDPQQTAPAPSSGTPPAPTPVPPANPAPRVATGNSVVNGAFVHGTSGWYASAGSVQWYDGAARVSHTGTPWADLNDRRNTVHSTTQGLTYCASADVRAMKPTAYARLRLMEYTPANKMMGLSYASVWLTDKRWHQLSIRYRARSTGASLDLNVLGREFQGRSMLVDNVRTGCR